MTTSDSSVVQEPDKRQRKFRFFQFLSEKVFPFGRDKERASLERLEQILLDVPDAQWDERFRQIQSYGIVTLLSFFFVPFCLLGVVLTLVSGEFFGSHLLSDITSDALTGLQPEWHQFGIRGIIASLVLAFGVFLFSCSATGMIFEYGLLFGLRRRGFPISLNRPIPLDVLFSASGKQDFVAAIRDYRLSENPRRWHRNVSGVRSMMAMLRSQTRDIVAMRISANMSQIHLADASGVSLRTIQRLESGQKVAAETLRCLLAVLDQTGNSSKATAFLSSVSAKRVSVVFGVIFAAVSTVMVLPLLYFYLFKFSVMSFPVALQVGVVLLLSFATVVFVPSVLAIFLYLVLRQAREQVGNAGMLWGASAALLVLLQAAIIDSSAHMLFSGTLITSFEMVSDMEHQRILAPTVDGLAKQDRDCVYAMSSAFQFTPDSSGHRTPMPDNFGNLVGGLESRYSRLTDKGGPLADYRDPLAFRIEAFHCAAMVFPLAAPKSQPHQAPKAEESL